MNNYFLPSIYHHNPPRYPPCANQAPIISHLNPQTNHLLSTAQAYHFRQHAHREHVDEPQQIFQKAKARNYIPSIIRSKALSIIGNKI